MKKYRTVTNYKSNFKPGSVKKEKGQSLTVPGQAISVKKLANEYESTGMLNSTLYRSATEPLREGRTVNDTNQIDITDRERAYKRALRVIDNVKTAYKAKLDAQKNEQIEAEVLKRLEEAKKKVSEE